MYVDINNCRFLRVLAAFLYAFTTVFKIYIGTCTNVIIAGFFRRFLFQALKNNIFTV